MAKYYIESVVSDGYLQVDYKGDFGVNDKMTRAMFVTMLWRLSGSPSELHTTPFADVSDSWYTIALGWAFSSTLIDGRTSDTFAPHEGITREEICVLLVRYFEFKEGGDVYSPSGESKGFADSNKIGSWAIDAVNKITAAGLFKGHTSGYFKPQGTFIRAEAAVVLCRMLGKEFENYTPPVEEPVIQETYLGWFESTFYCYGSKTATGTTPKVGRTIAIDPRIIPLGSKVRVEFDGWRSKYNGTYIAEDTGGVIKGSIVDVFLSSRSECYEAGRANCRIYLVKE